MGIPSIPQDDCLPQGLRRASVECPSPNARETGDSGHGNLSSGLARWMDCTHGRQRGASGRGTARTALHVSGEPHSRLKPERPATAELERLHVQAEAEGFCPTGMKGSWAGASQKEGGRKGNTLSSFRNDEWGHRQAALGQQGAAELV